jgi:hypothetical protein
VGFTCQICGRRHDERQRDIRMTWPEPVFRLSDAQRGELTDFGDDSGWFQDGERTRYYARGVIHLPLSEDGGDGFRFGIWVEVAEGDWFRLLAHWNDPAGAAEGAFAGSLANELGSYTGTEGLRVTLRLNEDLGLLPIVDVEERSHALGRDQASGISDARAHELARY